MYKGNYGVTGIVINIHREVPRREKIIMNFSLISNNGFVKKHLEQVRREVEWEKVEGLGK